MRSDSSRRGNLGEPRRNRPKCKGLGECAGAVLLGQDPPVVFRKTRWENVGWGRRGVYPVTPAHSFHVVEICSACKGLRTLEISDKCIDLATEISR